VEELTGGAVLRASKQEVEVARGPAQPRPSRWTLRRSLSIGLIVSGVIWVAIGLALRLFFS